MARCAAAQPAEWSAFPSSRSLRSSAEGGEPPRSTEVIDAVHAGTHVSEQCIRQPSAVTAPISSAIGAQWAWHLSR
eukprot:7389360-Prymnesium_polylepis.1